MAEPITTPEELEEYGFEVTETSIKRASARLRAYTGSPIILSPVVETFWTADFVRNLRSRPVASVTSVRAPDSLNDLSWTRTGSARIQTPYGPSTVSYMAGWPKEEIPEALIDLIGAVAERIDRAAASSAARGIAQESSGSTSISYSSSLVQRAEQFTPEEKATISRFFPKGVRFVPVNFDGNRRTCEWLL